MGGPKGVICGAARLADDGAGRGGRLVREGHTRPRDDLGEEALKYLPLISEGGKPPRYSQMYGGIDAFNAQTSEAKRGAALPEVLRRMDEVHAHLTGYLQSVPEEQFTRETPPGTACGSTPTAITPCTPG